MTHEPDTPLVSLFCLSPNSEPRPNGRAPDLLLLHYTGMTSADAALDRLTDAEASASPSARAASAKAGFWPAPDPQ